MKTILKKAARDLLGERGRSFGIVISLAVGIAAFLAVLSAYSILTREIDSGYEASNPVSATITVDDADEEAVRAAAGVSGVADAEARRTVLGRAKGGSVQWLNLALYVRRNLAESRSGLLELEGGAWPSGPEEIAIERDALLLARVKVGDRLSIRTEAGVERSFRVSASVHDVGVAQARMENMVYAYALPSVLASLAVDPRCDAIALRVFEGTRDKTHIKKVAAQAAAAVEGSGHRALGTEVPEPGHPHAKLMGALLLSNSIFGAFVLALSGIIVFNVLTALLAGQRRQIGVMKAIGGSRAQVAAVFLLEAGLLGAAAILIALPAGIMGGRLISRWLATFINFDIVSYAVPAWSYGLVLLVGLAVPILTAAIPVWLGTRTPVREALMSANPRGRSYGRSVLDRALSKVSGGSRSLLMAMRNLGRNRLRVALTLCTLAVAGIFCISALNERKSLQYTIEREFSGSLEDLSIGLASSSPVETAESAARGVQGVVDAEGWFMAEGFLPATGAIPAAEIDKLDSISVAGMPLGSKMMRFDLTRGEPSSGGTENLVANTTLFDRLGRPEIGSEIRLLVAGKESVFKLSGVQYNAFGGMTAYVSRAFFEKKPETEGRGPAMANRLMVSLAAHDGVAIDAALPGIDAKLKAAGIGMKSVISKTQRVRVMEEHMVMIYVFLLVVSSILGGVGLLGLITTVSLNVAERRREMGVLRAIGAPPSRIAWIIVIEGALVGALSWAASTAAAWPLSKVIGDAMLKTILNTQNKISFAAEPIGIIVWFFAVVGGSALASLWPALRAARASVRDALAYE